MSVDVCSMETRGQRGGTWGNQTRGGAQECREAAVLLAVKSHKQPGRKTLTSRLKDLKLEPAPW